VGADQDLLFGRIAVNRKYCTQEQLDKCLALQANSRDRVPLGQFLKNEGYITEDQHSEILSLQRKNLAVLDPVNRASKESLLTGRLAVKMDLMGEDDVNKCLRIQARTGEKRSLGEIMVEQGYLTAPQLKEILAKQHKRIMSCAACRLSFTVLSTTQAKVVNCPRCKGKLQEGKPTDSVRTDAHLDTSISHRIKKASAPKAEPGPASSVRMVRMTCPMCAKPFSEPVDSKGRVDCPHCLSSFSA